MKEDMCVYLWFILLCYPCMALLNIIPLERGVWQESSWRLPSLSLKQWNRVLSMKTHLTFVLEEINASLWHNQRWWINQNFITLSLYIYSTISRGLWQHHPLFYTWVQKRALYCIKMYPFNSIPFNFIVLPVQQTVHVCTATIYSIIDCPASSVRWEFI